LKFSYESSVEIQLNYYTFQKRHDFSFFIDYFYRKLTSDDQQNQ